MAKEYIEREAAIDALQNHYEVRNAVQNAIMDECVMLIMRVPAADVVPVVRCKDCKKGIPDNEHATAYSCYGIWHKPDWFCAGGERMDMVTDCNQVKDGDA